MITKRLSGWLAIALVVGLLWACGSNRDSEEGIVVGGGTVIASARTLGIDNCLICHSSGTAATDEWLISRHANSNMSPNNTNTDCTPCHDPLGDSQLISAAIAGETNRMVVGCESCHGGGQFHWGTGPIPFPEPGVSQCTKCHYVTENNFHSGLDRNINDTHNGTAGDFSGANNVNVKDIDGLSINLKNQRACAACHNAHAFDLTINLQWTASPHNEPAALGAWAHYNWSERDTCQRCHTTRGLVAFLNADINGTTYKAPISANPLYVPETLYCNGCHTDNVGTMRDPGELTLDFVNETPDSQSGVTEFVTLPDKGKSNVCAACHAGRGNNTSIRTGNRTSRFAGHHAPTAGSLYAAITHTGFEYTDTLGVPLVYNSADFEHDLIEENDDGPCAGCHMSGTANHSFEAVTEDLAGDVTAINNQALCDTCHGVGGITPANLNTLRAQFDDARQTLLNLVNNTVPNYLNADLTQRGDATAVPPVIGWSNAPLEAYGAFQNNLYMFDEPCIYLHNSRYAKRLIFDSIDWLEDGALNGTITNVPAWIGAARP